MPYIHKDDRFDMNGWIEELYACPPASAGELQFMFALCIREFMRNSECRYQDMNDVMGALAGAQQEFYRRVVAPYEDTCIERNGDIPGYAYSDFKNKGEEY